MIDVLVVRAGPAGVLAALRAADLSARTVFVTRSEFGGMAANDGSVPVRTLAHAARLIREFTQVAAIVIVAGMRVDDLAQIPLSFPTYAGILARAAASAARKLNLKGERQAHPIESTWQQFQT